jgi:hypothetical protein
MRPPADGCFSASGRIWAARSRNCPISARCGERQTAPAGNARTTRSFVLCETTAGHLANWEIGLPVAASLGLAVSWFYRAASDPAADAAIQEMRREAMGAEVPMFAKGSAGAREAFASSPYVGCGYTDAGLRTLRWLRGDRRTHALSRRANVPLKSCAGSPSDALPRHGVVVSCPSGQRPQGPLGGDLTRQPAVPRTAGIGVRRDKAALSSGCKTHPAIRSSRKQSEQSWR